MTKKIITITKCSECPYVIKSATKEAWYCNHVSFMVKKPYRTERVVPSEEIWSGCPLA
jgi:hypothetical protein